MPLKVSIVSTLCPAAVTQGFTLECWDLIALNGSGFSCVIDLTVTISKSLNCPSFGLLVGEMG